LKKPKEILESDSSYRKDLILLKQGDIKNADIQKDILENIQRNDRKIRKD